MLAFYRILSPFLLPLLLIAFLFSLSKVYKLESELSSYKRQLDSLSRSNASLRGDVKNLEIDMVDSMSDSLLFSDINVSEYNVTFQKKHRLNPSVKSSKYIKFHF